MAIKTSVSSDGNCMTIMLPERFDFSVYKDLREAYEKSGRCALYVVDLRGTRYIDSSALGMLLQLREFAGSRNDAVRITNADGPVRDTLRIANFHKLMNVA
ncbi:MAG: STAS domain-containing protein [Gammaproteobacteria bacterium]